MPLVRDYVEGLAVAHAMTRKEIVPQVKEWEATVRASMARGRRKFGRTGLGFAAVAIASTGERVQDVELFEDFMNRRQLLERRSRHVAALASHYVSGRAAPGDQ